MLRTLLQRLLLPPVCVLCGADGYGPDICRGCRRDLPAIHHACRLCARPLPSGGAGVCGQCLAAQPPWEAAFAGFRYEFPVDALVKGLKFSGRRVNGRLLGQLLALEARRRLLARGGPRPDRLVPVPLHAARQRQRGFNQAAEIARHAGALLGVPVDCGLCLRHRDTPAQVGLAAAERRRNVDGAFRLSGPVTGLRLAVVDDVLTTGATAAAVARALSRGRPASISLWVVARVSSPGADQGQTHRSGP